MKKKFAAITLTAIMLFTCALPMTAAAETVTINQDTTGEPKTGTSNITFSVNPTYTVTIPATVELAYREADGSYAKEMEISAENVKLLYGKQIVVGFAEGTVFELRTDEGAEAEYAINLKEGATEADYPAIEATSELIFNTSATAKTYTLIASAESPEYAGTYKGNLTFNLSVEDIPTP